jgi:dTDP-4-dehydrorhamnose reductase
MTRWLITGAGGQFGSVLLRRLARSGSDAVGLVSKHGPRPTVGASIALDLLDAAAMTKAVDRVRPTCIVHAAAVTSMAEAFANPQRAQQVNVEVTRRLAELASKRHQRMVLLSTDMVFDGEHAPYDEAAEPAPQTVYGQTKLAAERIVLEYDNTLVLRLPLLYGIPAVQRETTFQRQLHALRSGHALRLFADEYRTPVWLEDAAAVVESAASAALLGIVHAPGPERLSRADMGRLLAKALGVEQPAITTESRLDAGGSEPRPRDLSLRSRRFTTAFGRAAGRPMAEALQRIVARQQAPR